MAMGGPVSSLQFGLEELGAGRWEEASAALEEAVFASEDVPAEQAQALDALGEALWWLGRAPDAVNARERAYVLARQQGEMAAAARIAVWLSREYGGPLDNASAAAGWFARAETMAGETRDPCATAWLALGRADGATDPGEQREHAELAVQLARQTGELDLEILSLARLGLAMVALGDVDAGVSCVDEAMAAATAGEAERLSTVAEVYCQLVVATEMIGDTRRFGEWAKVVAQVSQRRNLPMLTEFCECCQAEVSVGAGDVHGAEAHLKQALAMLEEAGQRARCIPPTGKLAEIWLLQGRLAEAEHLLASEKRDDVLLPRARLALARGDHNLAAALAARVVRRRGGDNLLTAPAIAVLAECALAGGDAASAWLSTQDTPAHAGRRRSFGAASISCSESPTWRRWPSSAP